MSTGGKWLVSEFLLLVAGLPAKLGGSLDKGSGSRRAQSCGYYSCLILLLGWMR